MKIRTALFSLTLLILPAAGGHAGDAKLTIDGTRFTAETITLKKGDRLVVDNQSKDTHFVWGHAGSYAFDFRSTEVNTLTHKPGDSHAVVMNIPGTYRLGCALHKGMAATVVVKE